MRVLVACEYSGTVRDAFREAGHDAMSCDLLDTDVPGPHYQGDVRDLLGESWDIIVAHPPCTYLCNSGVRWLHTRPGRWQQLDDAAAFFRLFIGADCPRVAIENPVMHRYGIERIGGVRPAQTIQPYQFGEPASKRTCLWLRGLPPLRHTTVLERPKDGWPNQTPSGQCKLGPGPDRWKIRSATFQGIADAMAQQWGSNTTKEEN